MAAESLNALKSEVLLCAEVIVTDNLTVPRQRCKTSWTQPLSTTTIAHALLIVTGKAMERGAGLPFTHCPPPRWRWRSRRRQRQEAGVHDAALKAAAIKMLAASTAAVLSITIIQQFLGSSQQVTLAEKRLQSAIHSSDVMRPLSTWIINFVKGGSINYVIKILGFLTLPLVLIQNWFLPLSVLIKISWHIF